MADHKISGYMSSFWQALFASFIQLFSRIFPFAKAEHPSQEECHHHHPSSDSDPLHPAPNPSISAASAVVSQTIQPDPVTVTDTEHSDVDSLSQDDTMVASKKRGGQKRGGVKANPKKPVAASTAPVTSDQSNGISTVPNNTNASHASLLANKNNAPAGVTPLAHQRDTKTNPQTSDVLKPNGFKRNPSPTKQSMNGTDKKENAPPSTHESPIQGPVSQSSALKPIALADNKAGIQQPGTRSLDTVAKAAIPTAQPANDESIAAGGQVQDLTNVIDRLALDESSDPQRSSEGDLTTAENAAEAEALPVPIVVAVPIPPQFAAPRQTMPEIPIGPVLPGLIEPKTDEERAVREIHLKFMREALAMGSLALNTNETPVGCVLVYHDRVIAKGMNATNVTRNGTRHAEFMALSALLSRRGDKCEGEVNNNLELDHASWGDIDPRDGHIYPYGQKLHPAPIVDSSIISECILYVTVEPCVMCASLLRQLGIKKVYFGAVNDKFGGTGGVFKIHQNSKPVPRPEGRPYQNGYGPHDTSCIVRGRASIASRGEDEGDGGNVESGYPVEGGYLRDDAVSLLRRFYVQENGRAPQPRKKEGRAARLFAMENAARNGGSVPELSDIMPDAPVDDAPPKTEGAIPVNPPVV